MGHTVTNVIPFRRPSAVVPYVHFPDYSDRFNTFAQHMVDAAREGASLDIPAPPAELSADNAWHRARMAASLARHLREMGGLRASIARIDGEAPDSEARSRDEARAFMTLIRAQDAMLLVPAPDKAAYRIKEKHAAWRARHWYPLQEEALRMAGVVMSADRARLSIHEKKRRKVKA